MPYKDRETYLRKQREFAARRKIRKRIASAIQAHVNPALTPALKGISASNQVVTHTRMRRKTPIAATIGVSVSSGPRKVKRTTTTEFSVAQRTALVHSRLGGNGGWTCISTVVLPRCGLRGDVFHLPFLLSGTDLLQCRMPSADPA